MAAAGPSSESTAAAATDVVEAAERDRFDAAAALYRKCGTSNPVFALVQGRSRGSKGRGGTGMDGDEGGRSSFYSTFLCDQLSFHLH